jgi:predicted acyltransferase
MFLPLDLVWKRLQYHPTMETKPTSSRIASIDALRGFDMFWIMGADQLFTSLFHLSNSSWAKSLKDQLEHTTWEGFSFYDLIFPLFLFLVGVSIPLAFEKRLAQGVSRWLLCRHVLGRTAKLFFFGLLVNGLLDLNLATQRWPGVLQRIALCYCFASLAVLFATRRVQAILGASILVGYWLILLLVPVPGVGAGVLTQEGNLAGYLDRLFIPGKFCCYPFGDNEGILSTLPAVATTLLGVMASYWLRSSRAPGRKAAGLAGAGVVSLLLALAWNPFFPINKILWTSSYVLFAGGWSLLLLALFYWVIDMRGWKRWAFPFIVIGMNPITIYLAQALFDFGTVAAIFTHGFVQQLGIYQTPFQLCSILVVKWLFLYFLYRQRIFLKA